MRRRWWWEEEEEEEELVEALMEEHWAWWAPFGAGWEQCCQSGRQPLSSACL